MDRNLINLISDGSCNNTFSRSQDLLIAAHASSQLCSFSARKYAVQAQTRCHPVYETPLGGAASHVGSEPSGLIIWYQLFRVWWAQPPPTKAWPAPKWLLALNPKESMMLLHVGTLVAAAWSCSWEGSGLIETVNVCHYTKVPVQVHNSIHFPHILPGSCVLFEQGNSHPLKNKM